MILLLQSQIRNSNLQNLNQVDDHNGDMNSLLSKYLPALMEYYLLSYVRLF